MQNAALKEQEHNTPAVASVLEQGDIEEVRMILGDRERVRYAGIIRPGIKVPLSRCSDQEKKKYEELLAKGLSFDEIDRALGGEPKTGSSKLRPANVDYFTVRQDDFKNPADAEYILKTYADSDGKLRRIPVWFPVGELHLVIPHSFRAFGAGGTVRASSYYDGDKLMCRYVPKGVKAPKKDDWQTRDCDPDICEAYQKKRCDFGGLFRVNVPGLKGIGEVVVPTTSWYGLGDAIANLKRIAGVLGRFNGLFDGEPFLELCKVSERVKTPDGQFVNQWITTIEPSIDLMELARYTEPVNVMARAGRALNLLAPSQTLAESATPQRQETEDTREEDKKSRAAEGEPEASDDPDAGDIPADTDEPPEAAEDDADIPPEATDSDTNDAVDPVTPLQKKLIEKRAKSDGVEVAAVCGHFGIESLDHLDKSLFNDAVDYIKSQKN